MDPVIFVFLMYLVFPFVFPYLCEFMSWLLDNPPCNGTKTKLDC